MVAAERPSDTSSSFSFSAALTGLPLASFHWPGQSGWAWACLLYTSYASYESNGVYTADIPNLY